MNSKRMDNGCAILHGVQLGTKINEMEQKIKELEQGGGGGNKVHLYAYDWDGDTVYTTIFPTPDNYDKKNIMVYEINEDGYLVPADLSGWSDKTVWGVEEDGTIRIGDEGRAYRDSSNDAEIDLDRILDFQTCDFDIVNYNDVILPTGTRFSVDGKCVVADGIKSIGDYTDEFGHNFQFAGCYDGVVFFTQYFG